MQDMPPPLDCNVHLLYLDQSMPTCEENPRDFESACPHRKQTAPALSGSSKCASGKKLTLQKQLKIIMRPSRRCATVPECLGNYGSHARPITNGISAVAMVRHDRRRCIR